MAAPRRRDKILKSIGLAQKLFSRSQYDEAKRAAREQGEGASIGEVLVELGSITREQLKGLDRAITYRVGREEDKAVGRVIVDSGYADKKAVDRALEKQKAFYGKTGQLLRLGSLLVDDGTLTASQHKAALKIHGIEKNASDLSSPSAPQELPDEESA